MAGSNRQPGLPRKRRSKSEDRHSGPKRRRLAPDRVPQFVAKAEIAAESGEEEWSRETRSERTGKWAIAAGLLMVLTFLVILVWIIKATGEGQTVAPISVIDDRSPLEKSRACLEDFLAAADVDQRLPFVRHPEKTEARMRTFRARSEFEPLGQLVAMGDDVNVADTGQLQVLWFDVQLENGPSRTAVFEITPSGAKLDWESFVFYEELPWEQFRSTLPSTPYAFRIRCYPDNYFNYDFDDATSLLSLRILHPKETETFWGYVDRNSPLASSFIRLINKKKPSRSSPLNLILTLRFPPSASEESNQVWIDSIESEAWFSPN